MLVVLERGADRSDAERVATSATERKMRAEVVGAGDRWAVAITGGSGSLSRQGSSSEGSSSQGSSSQGSSSQGLSSLPRVARIEPQRSPYFLASRWFRDEPTVVDVAGVAVGGERVVLMAGPCAVEGETSLFAVAERLQKSGVEILRAGAFKPRTSPWSFQGLEQRGLDLLADVKRATGMRVVTEVVSEETLPAVAMVADLVQVGARSMKSYELLKKVGRCGRPVLLKRGPDAQLDELLASAEYLLAAGSPGVILCERGVCGFGEHARNTLDLAAVPALRQMTHLPVVVDPSHGTGRRDLVGPMARGAVAVGADGVLLEVHPSPEEALSDGPQALLPDDYEALRRDLEAVARAVGRHT